MEEIKSLSDEFYDSKRNMWIGCCIAIVGLFAFFIGSSDSQLMKGVFIGAGSVYGLVYRERMRMALRKLDSICLDVYGKVYFDSLSDIASDAIKTRKPW